MAQQVLGEDALRTRAFGVEGEQPAAELAFGEGLLGEGVGRRLHRAFMPDFRPPRSVGCRKSVHGNFHILLF
jgi:hypothetical protein